MHRINFFRRSHGLFFACLFTFAFAFPGCRSGQKEHGGSERIQANIKSKKDLSHILVGYCSPSLNAPFYVALSKAVQNDVEGYKMRFISVDGQNDITKQIKGIEDLISKGVNVLIINPLDPKALVPSVNAAAKSGIPVFIVDSYIDPAAKYVTSVMADNEGNGELLGGWAGKKLNGTPVEMALISGAQGNPVGKEKRMGFMRGIINEQLISQGHAGLNVVSQGWGGWSISGGLKAAEDILVAHPDINLLVCENDAMAIGALRAINESKDASHMILIGFDGQKEALKLIREGKFDATALNSPKELARLSVQSVVKYLNGDKGTGKIIHTQPVLIDHANVNKYYDPKALF